VKKRSLQHALETKRGSQGTSFKRTKRKDERHKIKDKKSDIASDNKKKRRATQRLTRVNRSTGGVENPSIGGGRAVSG